MPDLRSRPLVLPLLLALSLPACLALANPSIASASEEPALSALRGDWAGWAYLDEGGDLPLRLRLENGPQGLVARFDELVTRRYDLPIQAVEWRPPELFLERRRPDGTTSRLKGELRGGALRGRLDWAGYAGDFDLTRSPERLSRIAPERYEDVEGAYRLRRPGSDEARTVVVGSRFWGELLVTDLATGRFGTLFPVDRDRFFVGAAMYVPAPIHARVSFVRDDEGDVVAMNWREEASEAVLSGERIAFVEEEVTFVADDGATLAGTLIRPNVPGPLPAAVILGGSNWRERGSVRHDASVLAAFGMATLIYDKRGYGDSGGEAVVPFERTAADAVAAVEYLRGRSAVLPGQVGLTGRSRGGWFAPLAASRSEAVAFLVLFVPPAVSPAEQETTRRLNLLRGLVQEEGKPDALLDVAAEALREGWRFGATGEDWESYAAARRRAVVEGVPEDLLEAAEPDSEEWTWVRLNMAYDPVPALERVRAPVLALFGGADPNVVPADNLPPMRAALDRAGNPDVELVVVPDADHGLRVRSPGTEELPPHRQVGYGTRGWPRVERWLGERLDLWGRAEEP